jgi:hypothetical protein
MIDLHGVVDHELDGLEWIHLFRVAAKRHDAVTHRRKVHDARYAGEILEQDPRRHERDFLLRRQPWDPKTPARGCRRL